MKKIMFKNRDFCKNENFNPQYEFRKPLVIIKPRNKFKFDPNMKLSPDLIEAAEKIFNVENIEENK